MTGWATGPIREDKLAPETYGRIRTLFTHTWREEQLSSNFDWESKNFSVYIPESLYVVSSIFLKIDIPAIGNGVVFKTYAGIYPLQTVRLMSNGTEVYTCDVNLFLHDYCQSLSEEALARFSDTYLGGPGAASTARTVMIPILLPNSAYMGRAGGSHGHGIFPLPRAVPSGVAIDNERGKERE